MCMFWHNKFADVAPQINRLALVIMIAGGVGNFVAIALLRIVIQLPLALYASDFLYVALCLRIHCASGVSRGGFRCGWRHDRPNDSTFIMALE